MTETGLLVPPGDVAALAESVFRLLQERARFHRMGQAGRRRVEKHFRIERTVAELESSYQRLLANAF